MDNITHYIHDLKVEIVDINATDCPYRVTNMITGESWECPIESSSWHNCETLLQATKSNQDYLLHSLNWPDHEAVKLTRFKVQIRYLDGWADFKMQREYETAFYATEADALADYRDAYSPTEFRVVDAGTPTDGDIYLQKIQDCQNCLRDLRDSDPNENDTRWYAVIDGIEELTGVAPQ